jgi:serine/threonine protein kinase
VSGAGQEVTGLARFNMGSMNDPFIGSTIDDKYVVQSLLGEGGMSLVYQAVQKGVNRRVAIKILREELSSTPKHTKRMEREARSISELNHPNLVSIFDSGTLANGQPYHVLEYLDGQSLAELIDNSGAIPAARAIPIFIQVCDVMQYAHDHGLIDRDISPMNIMLIKAAGMDDFVKLVDFGILKFDENRHFVSQRLTATGEVCGNPMYMSPEQATADELDWRTDIYSLGVVMWEAVAGKQLFVGANIAEIVTKHLYTKPPKPSNINPDVAAAMEDVILKMLEKERSNRYQSMHEVKAALSQVLRKTRSAQESSLPAYYGKDVKNSETSSGAAARNVRQMQQVNEPAVMSAGGSTMRDLGIAFAVLVCAAACICLLIVRVIHTH